MNLRNIEQIRNLSNKDIEDLGVDQMLCLQMLSFMSRAFHCMSVQQDKLVRKRTYLKDQLYQTSIKSAEIEGQIRYLKDISSGSSFNSYC